MDPATENVRELTEAISQKLQEREFELDELRQRFQDERNKVFDLERRMEHAEMLIAQQSKRLTALELELRKAHQELACRDETSGLEGSHRVDRQVPSDTPPKTRLWRPANQSDGGEFQSSLNSPFSVSASASSQPPTNPYIYNDIDSPRSSSYADTRGNEDLVIGRDDVVNLMIRNIPCSCTKQDVLSVIAELGFANDYNFFHMPCPGSLAAATHNLGYAFVGFHNKEVTERFSSAITGYKFQGRRGRNSTKTLNVTPARVQGVEGIVEICQQRKSNRNQPTFTM